MSRPPSRLRRRTSRPPSETGCFGPAGPHVLVPLDVYEEFIRAQAAGPRPPEPPVGAWVERATYRLRPGDKGAELDVAFEVVVLPGGEPWSVQRPKRGRLLERGAPIGSNGRVRSLLGMMIVAVLAVPLPGARRARRGERPMTLSVAGHPRLAFTSEELPAIRARAETPEGRALVARLKTVLQAPDDADDAAGAGFDAAGHAMLYALDGDAAHAAAARMIVERIIADEVRHHGERLWGGSYKMILRTDPAVGVALTYDLCGEAWSQVFQEDLAAKLAAKAATRNERGTRVGGQTVTFTDAGVELAK